MPLRTKRQSDNRACEWCGLTRLLSPSCMEDLANAYGASIEPETTYTGPERRESPRYRVNLRTRWGGGEWAGREGTVTNLSAEGCYVMTEEEVTEGELVQVQVEPPDGEPLPLWGSVIHRAEGQGFAIQFSNFSQGGARERLKALLPHADGATAKARDEQRGDQ